MAKQVDIRIEGLNALLKDLRKLPKDATVELRRASVDIATRHMLPSWRAAALTAGDWGPKLADSIRVRSDRLPALLIGKDRKAYREYREFRAKLDQLAHREMLALLAVLALLEMLDLQVVREMLGQQALQVLLAQIPQ